MMRAQRGTNTALAGAAATGISVQAYNDIAGGYRMALPRPRHLAAIAAWLGVLARHGSDPGRARPAASTPRLQDKSTTGR